MTPPNHPLHSRTSHYDIKLKVRQSAESVNPAKYHRMCRNFNFDSHLVQCSVRPLVSLQYHNPTPQGSDKKTSLLTPDFSFVFCTEGSVSVSLSCWQTFYSTRLREIQRALHISGVKYSNIIATMTGHYSEKYNKHNK